MYITLCYLFNVFSAGSGQKDVLPEKSLSEITPEMCQWVGAGRTDGEAEGSAPPLVLLEKSHQDLSFSLQLLWGQPGQSSIPRGKDIEENYPNKEGI